MKKLQTTNRRLAMLLALPLSALAVIAFTTGVSAESSPLSTRGRVIERAISQFNLDQTNHQVSIRRGLDHVPELKEFTLRGLTSGEPRGMYPALLEYVAIDGSSGRAQVTIAIRVFDSVLVAQSLLTRGAELSDLSVASEWRDVTDFHNGPLNSLDHADGYRLRHNVIAGNVITAGALERIPDVEYGDEVTIEFTQGGLSLRASGSALEAGIIGETVRIRNMSSKKILKAMITAPGIVNVAARRQTLR